MVPSRPMALPFLFTIEMQRCTVHKMVMNCIVARLTRNAIVVFCICLTSNVFRGRVASLASTWMENFQTPIVPVKSDVSITALTSDNLRLVDRSLTRFL